MGGGRSSSRHLGCASGRSGSVVAVVGSFIGSAPRVFVYTALGVTNLSSPLVCSAIAVWCVTAIIRAFAARRFVRSGVRAAPALRLAQLDR